MFDGKGLGREGARAKVRQGRAASGSDGSGRHGGRCGRRNHRRCHLDFRCVALLLPILCFSTLLRWFYFIFLFTLFFRLIVYLSVDGIFLC